MISNAPISLLTKGLNLDKDVAKEDEKIFKLPIWLFEIIVSVVAFVFIFLSFIWIKGMPEIKNVQAGAFGKGYGFTLLALIFIYFLYLSLFWRIRKFSFLSIDEVLSISSPNPYIANPPIQQYNEPITIIIIPQTKL